MTAIAPLRLHLHGHAPTGRNTKAGGRPGSRVYRDADFRTKKAVEGYEPVGRIVEWVSPSGAVCFWDSNGFFVSPRAGEAVLVRAFAPRKILDQLTPEDRRKIKAHRRGFVNALKRVRPALKEA